MSEALNNPNAKAGAVVYGDPFTAQLLALASRVARTEVTVLTRMLRNSAREDPLAGCDSESAGVRVGQADDTWPSTGPYTSHRRKLRAQRHSQHRDPKTRSLMLLSHY